MTNLFIDVSGNVFSDDDFRRALMEVGADHCDTLFVHSDIVFGKLAGSLRRSEILECLYGVILEMKVKNIIFPTFTFSFCNNEDYNIDSSKSSMGALSEYVRKLGGRYRTDDPLLSVSVPDNLHSMFSRISAHSLGEGSALDLLHKMDDVKFLFFGAVMAECFTYVHYVEKMLDVPYRFDMPFEGKIIYPDGRTVIKRQFIHTQCGGVRLPSRYDYFEAMLEGKGMLKKRRVGNRYLACLSEQDAYRMIVESIRKDVNYFLEAPFKMEDLTHRYTYSTENGRITHC